MVKWDSASGCQGGTVLCDIRIAKLLCTSLFQLATTSAG
jgi:hypothetical protein